MSVIKKSIVIDCPAEKVYKHGTDPTRWYEWYVGLSEPEEMLGNGETGTKMTMKYKILGVDLPVSCEIVENTEKGDCYVWKGIIKGAINSIQTWTYVPEEENTEVMIDIEYEVPGNILGKLADILVVEKVQDKAMEETLKNLKTACES
jgi:uncharacterized membrane protein